MTDNGTLKMLQSRIDDYCRDRDDDDTCFGEYVADQILKDRDLSYEQLEDGNTDGVHDGGIDGIYLFVNGKWADDKNKETFFGLEDNLKLECHIFQFKNSEGFEEAVVDKLSSTINDLFDLSNSMDQLQSLYNSEIIRITGTFRELYLKLPPAELETDIRIHYVTKGGKPTERMKHKRDQLIRKIEQELVHGCKCDLQFVEPAALLKFARRSRKRKLELQFGVGPTAADDSGRSFIGLVNLETYYRFILDEDGLLMTSLFEANVRDWQGDNKVNRQILSSLQSRSIQEFWWLNNGVTILATSVSQRGSTLTLVNPSIVNGLQTSRTLFKHFSANSQQTDDPRRILARIIEVSDDIATGEEIIRATNSQTAVPPSAFISLDEVHRDIEEFFLRQDPIIYYDRRHNHYKNQGKRVREIMSIQRLTQCVLAAALFKPDDARGRPGDFLKSRIDENYNMVFNKSYPFELYYFCATLYRTVENLLKLEDISSQYDRNQALYLKYHVMTQIVLRHLKIPRNTSPHPIPLIARQKVSDIDSGLMLECTYGVLRLFTTVRASPGAFRWRSFEADFFNTLDGMLPKGRISSG